MYSVSIQLDRISLLVNYCVGISIAQSCFKSNCKQTSNGLVVQHSSFTKIADKKYVSMSANRAIYTNDGTQDERERACVKKCVDDGIDQCKSAHLSPTGLCSLFNQSAYDYYADSLPTSRESKSGWTSFHLHVSLNSTLIYKTILNFKF